MENQTYPLRERVPVEILVIALVGFLQPEVVIGEPWEYEANVELSVIHTDNIRLAGEGMEESEFVYMISPTIAFSKESERLNADIRYSPEAYLYDGTPDSDEVFHIVDASVVGALVRDAFFLSLSGTKYQTAESPDQSFPTSNLPITNNRVDSTIYTVNPYWEQRFGSVDAYAGISFTDTRFDFNDLSVGSENRNNNQRQGQIRFNNHEEQQGIAWGANYQYQRIEYDRTIPWDYQQAALDVGYWANGTTRIFVSGGLESSFTNFFDPKLDDEFWEVGFQYAPNQRLNLELAAGKRSFGDSYRANFSYQLRRGEISLTYDEDPSSRGELGLDRRPLSSFDDLDSILNQPGDSDRFLRRRGELAGNIELPKSDMSLRIFYEDRDQRTTAFGDQLASEQLTGIAYRWGWNLGSKSLLAFNFDFAARTFAGSDTDLNNFSIEYTYRLSNKISVALMAQHVEENGEGTTFPDYAENQLRLTFRVGI